MADAITIKALKDASLDAVSLEKFINGSDSETVLTRLSARYPTIQKALKELFESGGIAARFKTLTDLRASSLANGKYALVADDDYEKNGIYIKEGGVWLKSRYSPIMDYDLVLSDFMLKAADILDLEKVEVSLGNNLYSDETATFGSYLRGGGDIVAHEGYSHTEFLEVNPGEVYEIVRSSSSLGWVYDSSKERIGDIPAPSVTTNKWRFTIPANVKYMRVNMGLSDLYEPRYVRKVNFEFKFRERNLISSQWSGKKIAWYGTSIPAGSPDYNNQDVSSYANIAVNDLGGVIQNYSVPSGGIGLNVTKSFLKLTQDINYQNSMLDLIGTPDDPDLFVFDYGANDSTPSRSQIGSFDINDPYDDEGTGVKSKIDDDDINYFIGAYNKIISELLTAKPDAKFCFITHFSDDHRNNGMNQSKPLNDVIRGMAEHWQAPLLDLPKKAGIRNRNGFNNHYVLMSDGLHPASGNGSLVRSLSYIVKDFLVSIG